MQEITLSDNLAQIELEIAHHKQIAGQSIWEIGRRLNHVKENDLAHGQFMEWLKKIEFSQKVANQFMKVAKELPKFCDVAEFRDKRPLPHRHTSRGRKTRANRKD